jgi:hypothetical protein
VYGRRLHGETLSFGHAGILSENSFVMYDRKTDSLWVHVTGRAVWGPLKGEQLAFVPSTVTTWQQWKSAHPHTQALPGYRRGGFMGTYHGLTKPADLGLAVVVRFRGKLYPFAALDATPVLNDRFEGVPLFIYWSKAEGTAVAWRRVAGGRELTFEQRDGVVRDRETGSRWSWLRGEAVSGRLSGARLEPVSYNPILVERFRAFYVDGPIHGR